jgi:hypothetical protein
VNFVAAEGPEDVDRKLYESVGKLGLPRVFPIPLYVFTWSGWNFHSFLKLRPSSISKLVAMR